MALLIILFAALFSIPTLGANNWTEPCHNGECQWDLPSINGSGSGTMRLAGLNSSISDITSAGGWTIIDCSATSADQEIRLVCHDPTKCDHLYLNGAENTVVRLPNDCTSEPLALVTRVWNHTDQSIPASKRSLLERRDGPQMLVQGINLSTDFAAINSSQHGNVTVLVLGSSISGLNNLAQTVPGCDATAIASQSCNVTNAALSFWNPISGGSQAGSFNLPDKTFQTNLFNDTLSCPQAGAVPVYDGRVSVDLESTVGGSINYAVAFAGLLSALDSGALSLVVGFDASLDGTLSLDADLTGTFTTGDITLLTVGLPGMAFGSFFKIGPTFNVYAAADVSIQTNLKTDIGLSYIISGGQLVYPPSQGASSVGLFSPGNSNVKLSAGLNVTANTQVAAHVKPSFEFGMSLLKQNTVVYLELDSYAEADLWLTATTGGSVSPADGSNSTGTSTATGASGCVDVLTALSVNAGAEADFFKIFKASDRVSLFDQSFDLYKKCFGNNSRNREYRVGSVRGSYRGLQGPTRRHNRRAVSLAAVDRRRIVRRSSKGFSCPTSPRNPFSPIVSETVDAGSYQEHDA